MLEAANDPIVQAIRTMILAVSEPLTTEDHFLIERAKSFIEIKYAHGFNQLAAIGVDDKGHEYSGLQMDCPIGQDSNCAEVAVFQQAVQASQNLVTLVTVHKKRPDEGGEVHVVASCPSCCGRYLHYFPNGRMIAWFEKELRKVPIRALIPIPYKARKRPNGNCTSQHVFST